MPRILSYPASALLIASLIARETSAQAVLARFADPSRATRLAAAYPEIDRLFTDFTTREHIPGAAWGIIVDGKLVHIGVTGYRSTATRCSALRR